MVTFVFNNLWIRQGMESEGFLQPFWSISLHQISLVIRFSSSEVVGFGVETFFLISVHKFSIGLRSGEFSGHLSTLTFLIWNQFMTDLAYWHGAESCWNVVHLWMLIKFSRWLSRTLVHRKAFVFVILARNKYHLGRGWKSTPTTWLMGVLSGWLKVPWVL